MMLPDGDRPRVTVVIATFNSARTLRCAIQSVLAQQFAGFEVTVVGDACTDSSIEMVRSFGDQRVRWLNREHNCGSQWGPNNDGIAIARGDYVAFLGHDDLWFPWHLAALVPHLDKGADLAHSICAFNGPDGIRGAFTGPAAGDDYGTAFVPPSSLLIRKTVLEAVGGFRDAATLSRGTDHDLMRRIFRAGYRIESALRLSVLKFPSHWWRSYAANACVPQERWLAEIAADSPEAERKVLTALEAAAAAGDPIRDITLALRAALRGLRNRLEPESGVIQWAMRQHFQYRRRRLKRLRGL